MAGIYIHIPFCKSRCVYCDFYSTTSLEQRQRYVDALCKEMVMCGSSSSFLEEMGSIKTIYLGGGTPSQLMVEQLRQLFIYINKVYDVMPSAEITIECNPDDVDDSFAAAIADLPVNRVSMGVQTFSDERLCFLRRRHNAGQVAVAVERLRRNGIGNISIDLIYGFPKETLKEWHADIAKALGLQVEHISAYALQYEEATPLGRMLQQGLVKEVDEELSRQMYYDLKDCLFEAGYEHYEISNFARPGFRSRHNSGYWNQTPYLGFGAAAHSYGGHKRQWNVADIQQYMKGMEWGTPFVESEVLDDDTRYNELVMTALRTCEGLPLSALHGNTRDYCLRQARPFVEGQLLKIADDHMRLTREGLFVSDMVISDLMKV